MSVPDVRDRRDLRGTGSSVILWKYSAQDKGMVWSMMCGEAARDPRFAAVAVAADPIDVPHCFA